MSITLEVVNLKGEKSGNVDLPESVFGVKAPQSLIHDVVNAYLANRRRGTHSTKTRGEVSGGGLKPWKQKHTGRARSGSIRSPLWRHGGVIFGPKPRSYNQAVSPAQRRLALRAVLSDIAKEGKLKIIDGFSVSEPKSRVVADIVKKLKLSPKTLLVLDQIEVNVERAARNVASLRLRKASDLNSYEALLAHQIVMTKAALEQISNRLGGSAEAVQ